MPFNNKQIKSLQHNHFLRSQALRPLSIAAVTSVCFLSPSAHAQLSKIVFSDHAVQAGLSGAQRSIAIGGRYSMMAGGGASGDFNNDGFDDIFMLSGGGFADYLYINNQDGTFTNMATHWNVAEFQHSSGASAADFNNDGLLDLFVTSYGPTTDSASAGFLKLYQNNGPDANGQWSFTDVAQQAGINSLFGHIPDGLGAAWGDYDLDGDLDLYICGYDEARPCNRLFKNNGPDAKGRYTFTDVTDEAGISIPGVSGFDPQLVDMNNDLYPDLIVIADTGKSQFFINNQDGTFTNKTSTAQNLNTANGMGIDIGDLNNDGLLDMYVTSVTFPDWDGPGNVMLMQNQDKSYSNTARNAGTYNGYWGWGTIISDFDHDGDRDIAETNGFMGSFSGNPSVIFENLGDGTSFGEVAFDAGLIHNQQGRGMVRLDIENDGDIDLVIFNINTAMSLYRNELIQGDTPADKNWIRIKLNTIARDSLAPGGIGAMVKVITGDTTQLLPMHCGMSHCSTSTIEVHAGIADATTIDAIRIDWADGSFTTMTDVAPNQVLTINASSHPADYTNDAVVDIYDVFSFISSLGDRNLVADHNGDMMLNYFDISAFLNDFYAAN